MKVFARLHSQRNCNHKILSNIFHKSIYIFCVNLHKLVSGRNVNIYDQKAYKSARTAKHKMRRLTWEFTYIYKFVTSVEGQLKICRIIWQVVCSSRKSAVVQILLFIRWMHKDSAKRWHTAPIGFHVVTCVSGSEVVHLLCYSLMADFTSSCLL